MNEQAKTPWTNGPWVVDTANELSSVNADFKHIAMVNYWRSNDPKADIPPEEHNANARLISKAPELADSLESIIDLAEASLGDFPNRRVECDEARALLAHIRGEA